MRVAFYSPIAQPHATTPSGVSRVGALLVDAIKRAGNTVDTPPLPRSYEGRGDLARQKHLFSECENAATNYLEAIALGREPRPDLWFSYHVYYKSPDWIGPHVAKTLGIPYIVAEGSHAPKRSNGPWALGHEGTTKALQAADRLLALTSFDRVCLEWIAKDRVRDLRPFIDASPFAERARKLSSDRPRLLTVCMMRNDRKRASCLMLAAALKRLPQQVKLTIVGDGEHRAEIDQAFKSTNQPGVKFLGAIPHNELPQVMAAHDIFAWPGIGEAYGLVYLEAQAAGLPVVACSDRGVPDVVMPTETALLSKVGDDDTYAQNLQTLIADTAMRQRMSQRARRFVVEERDIAAAANHLRTILGELRPA
jgi:glycosyltransferase involved in cell wall biosynthesis